MLVYFADLAHDHFKVNQYTPTGIGYLTAYSKFKLGDHVEFRLFKSVNKFLSPDKEFHLMLNRKVLSILNSRLILNQ